MAIDRSLLIVIDSFSDRSLQYDNVTLFDYGVLDQISRIDNQYNVYTGEFSGYGNVDDIIVTESYGEGFYQVSPDSDNWDSATVDRDFIDSGSFIDSFGYTAYYDEFSRLTRLGQSSEISVNHGDWVVEAINQTLNNTDTTEILAIDVDDVSNANHFGELFDSVNYFFDGISNVGSALEKVIYDFYQKNDSRFSESSSENFALAGISMSISGAEAPPNANESSVLEFLASAGLPLFQSAPNVNKGYFDWSTFFEDVISVGAWNQNVSGNLLVGSESSLSSLDIVADGLVEKIDWGANFGTSFATPKVAAEWVNALNSAIEALNMSGSGLEALELPNLENFDYSDYVNSIIKLISTPISATINGSVVEPIAVSNNTVEENGYLPKAVAGNISGLNYYVSQASQYVANTPATFSDPTHSGSLIAGTTVSTSISYSDPDQNSDGIVVTGWFLDDGDLSNGIEQQLTDYTSLDGAIVLDAAWVGKTLYFTKGFEDDLGSLEASWDGTSTTGIYRVGEITAANTPAIGSITISGTAEEDQTLTTVTGALAAEDNLGELSYQWKADGVDIAGATSNTLTLGQSEVGTAITVAVSYADDGGTAETVTSSATSAVTNVNDAPTGSVEITGAATEGEKLTAMTSALADEDGLGELSYQWLRDGSEINGATASSFILSPEDVGFQIRLSVSYTDDHGTEESLLSTPTGSVEITPVVDPAFDIALASTSGNVATFEVYATEAADSGDPGLDDVQFVLSHNLVDMTIDEESIDLADGFGLSIPNYDETTGELGLAAIAIPPVTDLAAPVLTFDATILNKAAPFNIAIDEATVDDTSQERVEEEFDFTSIEVESTVVGRVGQELSDVRVSYDFVTSSGQEQSIELPLQGVTTVSQMMPRGSDVIITADKSVDENSTDAITANDALQALRLAVGLAKSDGTAEWHDYIAADINKDGQVSANDALNILKLAVGLDDADPADWVFSDSNADYSGIDRKNTSYDEGVSLENVVTDTSVDMTGILVGDVNGNY